MVLPPALTQALREGRLLVLWGALPFPLAARPPAERALALNRLVSLAASLELAARQPEWPEWLPRFPPLPILSLDASARLERAFQQASVPLQVVSGRRDVLARGRHALLKLAGDLETRHGVILSRAEVNELHNAPDKRHLLAEAGRLAANGALLLLGCAPGSQDFRAWWSVLAPAFQGASLFAVGEPAAAWPAGVICLEPDSESLIAALWAAQPPEPPSEAPVDGGIEGHWEAWVVRLDTCLEALSAQLGRGVDDLKRGQAALYHRVGHAYRGDLARVLAAVQQGQLEQGEMRATLNTLRHAMRAVMERGLPMDAELRAAVADLTEAVESSLSLERKLELSLPLLPPFLEYKIELAVDSVVDLHDLWAELRQRWQQLVERAGGKEKPKSG